MKETYRLEKEVKVAVEPEKNDGLLDKLDEVHSLKKQSNGYDSHLDYL
ncbi:MAG: hypothetical protein ACMXYE_05545 [Candidatus Woesearchaeota archaeon]